MSKQGIFIGLNYWILWSEILFCHFWFSLHGDGQESVVNSHKSGMWVGNESVEVPLPVNKRRKSYLSSALWKISEYYNQLALQNEPFILQMNFEFHRLRLQLVTVLILVCRLSKLCSGTWISSHFLQFPVGVTLQFAAVLLPLSEKAETTLPQ